MRVGESAREAVRNVFSYRVLSAVIFAAVALLSSAGAFLDGGNVSQIADREHKRIVEGINVVQVSPVEIDASLDQKRCDLLSEIDGVRAAGSLSEGQEVRSPANGGSAARYYEATLGAIKIAYPEDQILAHPAKGFAGRAISESHLLTGEAELRFVSDDGDIDLRTTPLFGAPRLSEYESGIFSIVAPHGPSSTCFVEAESGAIGNVLSSLPSWFSPVKVVVSPLVASQDSYTPQDQVRDRLTSWFPVWGGVFALALLALYWRMRDRDFALYAIQGQGFTARAVMIATEVVMLVLVPSQIGIAISCAWFLHSSHMFVVWQSLAVSELCWVAFWFLAWLLGVVISYSTNPLDRIRSA